MIRNDNYISIQGWMLNKLNLSGNDLLVYAIIFGFSQSDNDCFMGGQQYLADWCGCSVRGVQKNLQNLLEKNLIEKVTPNTNKVRVGYKVTRTKFVYEHEQSSYNNIIDNKKDIIINNNILEKSTKTKKKNNTEKIRTACLALIQKYTTDSEIKDLLIKFVEQRIALIGNDYEWTAYKLKSTLTKLDKFPPSQRKAIIQQTLDNNWATFYDLKKNRKYNPFKDSEPINNDFENSTSTEQDEVKRTEFIQEMRKQGKRTVF